MYLPVCFCSLSKKNAGFRVIDHRISKYHLVHKCDNFVTTHKILIVNISINILGQIRRFSSNLAYRGLGDPLKAPRVPA